MKNPSKIGLYIAKIHQSSDRIFSRKLRERDLLDLNPSQGRVLFALREKDLISIQELAETTSLSNSTLTAVLDKLESKGLIKRIHDKIDRRKYLIKLQSNFLDSFKTYYDIVIEMSNLFFEGFTNDEIAILESKLLRIMSNLEKYEKL